MGTMMQFEMPSTRALFVASVLCVSLAVGAYAAELVSGRVTTAAPTYATGNPGELSIDTSGNLRVASTFTPSGTQAVSLAAGQPAQANWGQGATGATPPPNAALTGVRSGANMVALIQADQSVPITMSTATTTEFVALSGSTKIYITSFDFIAAGTTNVTLKYGTGTNCGTGTTSLTGAYTLIAQAGIAKGNGIGPVLVVPAGNAFCVTNSQAIVIGGSISYTQF